MRVPPASPDFQTALAARIAAIAPEVLADGKIDCEALRGLLDDDAAGPMERFGLVWPGKREAQRLAQTPTTATLEPDRENSRDWDTTQNVVIEGDNLEVLKVLQRHYFGQIKMIYIDPPYNTGKDFVYSDDYRDGVGHYLEWTEQVTGSGKTRPNSETEGRFHSNWLNMMYPRLKLARNLLSEDGIILVSIDDTESANLRILLDAVFGEGNLVAQFVWHSSTGGGIRSKHVNTSHQFVFCYARNKSSLPVLWASLSPEAIAQYRQQDERGLYRDKDFAWKNASTNPNQIYPIVAPDGEVLTPKPGYIYRFVRETFEEALSEGLVTFKRTQTGPFLSPDGSQANWNVYIKKYLGDAKGAPTSVLPRGNVGINNEGTTELEELLGKRVFDNPKSTRLLRYLLNLIEASNCTVLDFFAGSGTTAHAVMQLNAEDGGNRRCISVQLPEPTPLDSPAREAGFDTISQITRERIRRAGDKILSDQAAQLSTRSTPLDVGFRAYRLSDTHFRKWALNSDVSAEELDAQLKLAYDSAEDTATPEQLFTEVALKHGLSLTESYKITSIAGLEFFSIEEGLILGYFDEHVTPTLDQLRQVIDTHPSQFFILEDVFASNDELKANLAQMCSSRGIDLVIA